MDNNKLMGIPVPPGAAPQMPLTEPQRLGAFPGGMTPPSMGYIQHSTPETLFNSPAFPEIYYLIQPQVMLMCDKMDALGTTPSPEMMENAADMIFSDVIALYPDIVEYANVNTQPMPEAVEASAFNAGRGFHGRQRCWGPDCRFRRRGILRDVIDTLLLSEFYRRRRRRW